MTSASKLSGSPVDDAQSIRAELSVALEHLRIAIEQLDQACAPAHIAAHVDLALNQLQIFIGAADGRQDQIDTNAEAQR